MGTANLVLWDVTNAAQIGSTITSGQEQWQRLWMTETIPATCEQVAVRLQGAESNADLYWNHVVLYRTRDMRLLAPSWLDEPWKFLKLREAVYARSLATGRHDAMSRYFRDWFQPQSFSLDPLHTETNPYAIQLLRRLPNQSEMWINGKRPFSDLDALGTEAATTTAPLHLVYAFAKIELARILTKRYPQEMRWKELLVEATGDAFAETHARPDIPFQPKQTHLLGRI